MAAEEGETSPTRAAQSCLLRLRLALGLFAVGALVGGPWDMLWHMEHVFESFFSPPHLFIYALGGASMAVVVWVAARPQLREALGGPREGRLARLEVPAPLLLLGGGLLVILTSGALDELWHAAFGVDETRFSLPHAMFGWGLFVATLGFVSCRRALRDHAPVGASEAVLLGVLLLAFTLYAVLLPFLVYPTQAALDAIQALPAIQAQPGAQHTFRIYEAWQVHRGNLVFAPLAALWAGLALRLVRALDDRHAVVLGATGVGSALYALLWWAYATRLGLAGDPRVWLPLPIFLAAVVWALAKRSGAAVADRHEMAAVAFALAVVVAWPADAAAGSMLLGGATALAAAAAFLVGEIVGELLGQQAATPTARGTMRTVAVLGLCVPVLAGLLDLQMRLTTP